MRLLSSEWLKTKHTAIRWLTFCAPIIIALCVVGYLSINSNFTQQFVFEGFYTIWTAILIPVAVGVLAGFIVHEEEIAGNFMGFLGVGILRSRLFIGKFLFLWFCMTSCTFIAALILSGGMELLLPCGADIKLFLTAALLASVGTLPLIALHLWISFAWGLGASIGTSFAGLLMAVLFGTTSLGASIWKFVPWTWPVKLGLLPGASFVEESANLSVSAVAAGAIQTCVTVLIVTCISLIVLLLGAVIWFNRWEGSKD